MLYRDGEFRAKNPAGLRGCALMKTMIFALVLPVIIYGCFPTSKVDEVYVSPQLSTPSMWAAPPNAISKKCLLSSLDLRGKPVRKIYYGLLFNHELDVLEVLLHEIYKEARHKHSLWTSLILK